MNLPCAADKAAIEFTKDIDGKLGVPLPPAPPPPAPQAPPPPPPILSAAIHKGEGMKWFLFPMDVGELPYV